MATAATAAAAAATATSAPAPVDLTGLPEDAARVLRFWLGDPERDDYAAMRMLWFKSSPDLDATIEREFGALVRRAMAGELDAWASFGPRGALALVILLDQFTRNIFRGSPEAFAGDARALRLAHAGVADKWWESLRPFERMFALLPLEHSEALSDQELSVAEFSRVPELAQGGAMSALHWAKDHRDTIARFGRFPHRNAILGRADTPEEAAFLGSGSAQTYGQEKTDSRA